MGEHFWRASGPNNAADQTAAFRAIVHDDEEQLAAVRGPQRRAGRPDRCETI
jgi:hypothetical protein